MSERGEDFLGLVSTERYFWNYTREEKERLGLTDAQARSDFGGWVAVENFPEPLTLICDQKKCHGTREKMVYRLTRGQVADLFTVARFHRNIWGQCDGIPVPAGSQLGRTEAAIVLAEIEAMNKAMKASL